MGEFGDAISLQWSKQLMKMVMIMLMMMVLSFVKGMNIKSEELYWHFVPWKLDKQDSNKRS